MIFATDKIWLRDRIRQNIVNNNNENNKNNIIISLHFLIQLQEIGWLRLNAILTNMGTMTRTTSTKNDSLLKKYPNSTAATNNTVEGKALGSQIYKWKGLFLLKKFLCFSRVLELL